MWFLIAQMAVQAYAAYSQGRIEAEQQKTNQAIARHNALLADADARAAEIRTDEEQMIHLFQAEQAKGAARVRQAASGAATGVGAPFKERAQLGSWLDFESFRIGREGRATVEDFRQESAAERFRAERFGQAAKSAKTAGKFGAASAILGGLVTGTQQGVFPT